MKIVILLATLSSFAFSANEWANATYSGGDCTVTCTSGVSWTQSGTHIIPKNSQEGCNKYFESMDVTDLQNRCNGGVASGNTIQQQTLSPVRSGGFNARPSRMPASAGSGYNSYKDRK